MATNDSTHILPDAVLRDGVAQAGPRHGHIIVVDGAAAGSVHALVQGEHLIGRDIACDIMLDDEGVSRRHVLLRQVGDGWVAADQGSTNGFFINGDKVETQTLRNGDLLQIGSVIVKFRTMTPDEAKEYRQRLDDSRRDELTGAYSKRRFSDQIGAAFNDAGPPSSLVFIEIDRMREINEIHGQEAGDAVLRLFVKRCQDNLAPDLSRIHGKQFAAILALGEADALAACERFRRTVASVPWEVETAGLDDHGATRRQLAIRVTLSIGLTEISRARHATVKDAVSEAESYLFVAKRDGRDRVSCGLVDGNVPKHKVLGPEAFLSRLADGKCRYVFFALKINDAVNIPGREGYPGMDRVLERLSSAVARSLTSEEVVGRLTDRIVVAAVQPARAEAFRAEVADRWNGGGANFAVSLPSATTADAAPQLLSPLDPSETAPPTGVFMRNQSGSLDFPTDGLSIAFISEPEGAAAGNRILLELAGRLEEPYAKPPSMDALSELPFPIVASRARVAAMVEHFLRAKLLLDGFEASVKFLCAVRIAHALAEGALDRVDIDRYQGPALTFGRWLELLHKLQPRERVDSSDPIVAVFRKLEKKRGTQRSVLAELQDDVARRNDLIHKAALPPEAYEHHVRELTVAFDAFVACLRPLAATTLVSLATVDGFGEGDLINYRLAHHQGPSDIFPLKAASLAARLQKGWCYLLRPASSPLCLAPIIGTAVGEGSKRVEVYLSRGLDLGKKGEVIPTVALVGSEEVGIPLPFDL